MSWFMQWKVQTGLALGATVIALILAGDNSEKLPSISLAILAAGFWSNATRLYLAEKR